MSTPSDRTAALLATPSLEALSYALRHPETWPKGFVWSYMLCPSCAMGLSAKLWKRAEGWDDESLALMLKMDEETATRIFYGVSDSLKIPMKNVTTDHVADAIDAYLNTRSKT
ncbi:MAG: hypothetical protein KGL39_30415 [Patescibacteria group bacterium]|nr:hypothetical protein [Patescibacteria group bacterium]